MVTVVVPARNEEQSILKVLHTVMKLPVDLVIPVVNGSTDKTLGRVGNKFLKVKLCHLNEPLGVDVPRAVGACKALREGASVVLFIDGDMEGVTPENLLPLIEAVKGGADLALTDCYPEPSARGSLARRVLYFREKLNRDLGLFNQIGVATPSHGPHALSRNFLKAIPMQSLAVPPTLLALAARNDFSVSIAAAIPHELLGSPVREAPHNKKIANTIIGDCIEALCAYRGEERTRSYMGQKYVGYNNERRFDILERFVRAEG